MANTNARITLALDTSSDMLCCSVARTGTDTQVLAVRDHMCRRHANEELVSTALAALAVCTHPALYRKDSR